MLVVIVIYQQLENNILTPTIQGKATDISGYSSSSWVVTIGSALLGVLGALVAVPVAASLQIVIQEVSKARKAKVDDGVRGGAGAGAIIHRRARGGRAVRWRMIIARVLVVLAAIFAVLSLIAGFVRWQSLDTDSVEGPPS